MTKLDIIAALQIVIILLVCVPQRQRKTALLSISLVGLGFLAILFVGAPLLGGAFQTVRFVVAKVGWVPVVLLAAAVTLTLIYRSEVKQNRAIRAGSTEAFDDKVKDLMRNLNYSHEDAIAAARRIRDEGR